MTAATLPMSARAPYRRGRRAGPSVGSPCAKSAAAR